MATIEGLKAGLAALAQPLRPLPPMTDERFPGVSIPVHEERQASHARVATKWRELQIKTTNVRIAAMTASGVDPGIRSLDPPKR